MKAFLFLLFPLELRSTSEREGEPKYEIAVSPLQCSESHWTLDIFQFSQHKTKNILWHLDLDVIIQRYYFIFNIMNSILNVLVEKIMRFDDVKMFTSSFVSMCWKCKFGKMTTQKNLRSDYKCQFSILTDNDGSAAGWRSWKEKIFNDTVYILSCVCKTCLKNKYLFS